MREKISPEMRGTACGDHGWFRVNAGRSPSARDLTRAASTVAAITCLLAATGARAAELQQPTQLHTAGLPTNPPPGAVNPPGSSTACPALSSPAGPVDPGRLVIRDTDRPDVGPYTVKLPGYGTDPASSAQDSYRPFVVTASPGDTLRFDVVDQLGASEPLGGVVNLHTHGLIVSPRPCVPLGDYIFVHGQPGTTTYYRMDIPSTLPGRMFGSQSTPQRYPSGLNWFHAHVHEKAAADVMAGQAGMLYVGDLHADLLAAPSLAAASASTLNRTDVLYMGLRDIQLAVPRGATPDRAAAGQRAQWIGPPDYDSGACPLQANPHQPGPPASFAKPGYCGHHGAKIGKTTDASQDTVWMFTVNGQYDPTVTMAPGRHQIWRIANLSASLTYVLELVDDATGQLQPMNVLALDGLVAGTGAAGSTDLRVGVKLKHLLLMPASRAEVFVPNVAGYAARPMTLRTAGITTGPAGDPWPRIDLAHVVMQPFSPGSTPQTVSDATLAATDPAQVPLDVTLPGAVPASAVPTASQPVAATAAVPTNCVTLPTGDRRRITLLENGSPPTGKPQPFDFGFMSEVVTAAGASIDSQHTIGPQGFPMAAMLAPNSVEHVCPRLGTQEVWELVNATGEIHNFHLHQDKFRLSVQSDAGAPASLVSVQDPTSLVAHYEPETQGAVPAARVDVWHDVLPVPPAQLNADGSVNKPGRVFVTIPFYARQQVGDFVFHCHILEHEDGGMMAPVQVYDPAQTAAATNGDPAQFASLLRGSICGLPPRITP